IADLSHDRFFDLLYTDAANHAGDQGSRRVEARGFHKESLEVDRIVKPRLQCVRIIAGQPADNLVDLRFRAPLLFSLCDVVRIDARNAGRIYPVLGHAIFSTFKSFQRLTNSLCNASSISSGTVRGSSR